MSASVDDVSTSGHVAFLLIFKSLFCDHTERICREFFAEEQERLDQMALKPLVLQMAEEAVLATVSSIG